MFEQCVSMGDKYVGTANNTRYLDDPHRERAKGNEREIPLHTCCCGRSLLGIAYSEQSTGSRIVIILQIQVLQQRIRIRVLGGKGLKEEEEENTLCQKMETLNKRLWIMDTNDTLQSSHTTLYTDAMLSMPSSRDYHHLQLTGLSLSLTISTMETSSVCGRPSQLALVHNYYCHSSCCCCCCCSNYYCCCRSSSGHLSSF